MSECQTYNRGQIKDLERFASRLLDKYDIDVEFTKHFADRLGDSRNDPCIKISEIQDIFRKLERSKGEKIKSHGEGQAILLDIQKDLNLPIVIDYNRKTDEWEIRAKTIMRKRNFLSPDRKIKVESFLQFIRNLG